MLRNAANPVHTANDHSAEFLRARATLSRDTAAAPPHPRPHHRAFSLLELLVVMAVAVLLTGLLFPALAHVRENVYRVVSSSNMRQIGLCTSMYYGDNAEHLPYSWILDEQKNPRELMAATANYGAPYWDGFGRLYWAGYAASPEIFYSPSHRGSHPYARYADLWRAEAPPETIYTNYHYSGHQDWATQLRRHMIEGEDFVLATDGLRTRSDLNHPNGINLLYADLSVRWLAEASRIIDLLPETPGQPTTYSDYVSVWRTLEEK